VTVERIVIGCELHPRAVVADYRRGVQDGRAVWVEVPSAGGLAEQWVTEQTNGDGVIITEGSHPQSVLVCRWCRQPLRLRHTPRQGQQLGTLALVLEAIVRDCEPVDGEVMITLQRVRKLITELGR